MLCSAHFGQGWAAAILVAASVSVVPAVAFLGCHYLDAVEAAIVLGKNIAWFQTGCGVLLGDPLGQG